MITVKISLEDDGVHQNPKHIFLHMPKMMAMR